MTTLIISVAALVTVASAVRSTWSPCGLSMLASITPLSETGRGNRFGTTATWFVVGSTVGGLTLGLGVAVLAVGVHGLALSSAALGVAALATAVLAAASDIGVKGFRLPVHHRQVNERWLDQFRPWVYAAGFGGQIGSGLATYITTAAVYLMIVLGALGGSPVWAVALGIAFGFVRGLSVLLGRNITDPDALRRFHRRFVDAGSKVNRITVLIEVAAADAVAWMLSPPIGLGVAGVLTIVGVILMRRRATAPTAAMALTAATDDTGVRPPGSGPAHEPVTVP
jgi:MFS family permease